MVEPYYDDGQSTIYHGDCLDVLPALAEVGLVLTSPPYNLSGDGNKPNGVKFSGLANGYGGHNDAMPHVAYVAWQQDVLRACWSTLTDDGAIFYNHKPIVRGNQIRLPLELIPDDIPLRQIVTWDRVCGINRQYTYFMPTYEWILMLTKSAFRLTTRTVRDVWRIQVQESREIGPIAAGRWGDSDHPAPFPLAFARTAITATGAALVVDPFMGSGTTLRAAKDCGRRSIGIELEERWCEAAAKRLSQEVLDLWAG